MELLLKNSRLDLILFIIMLVLGSGLVLTGCDLAKQYLGETGDTIIETDDGKKTACVLNMDTCMRECITEHVPGVKVQQSFKVESDLCSLPEEIKRE